MTAEPLGPLGLALVPGLLLIAAGVVLLRLRGAVRDAVVLAAPLAILVLVWLLPDGAAATLPWLGYELVVLRVDRLARLFATVFAIAALAGGLFALRQERQAEVPVAFMYAGAALGVVFAGDLITVFVFWEVMAVCSTLIVWMGGAGARGAGLRYIVIHLFGGVLLMAGIAGHQALTGDLAFTAIRLDSPAAWLILAGFLLNAGAWPVSAWLPDAYPEASWSGTVFLSAFTTKTAVYALLRGFPGEELLVWVGLVMAFYGIIYASLENDMRRLLAYLTVNQVGVMITGIGIGTTMALNAAAGHAFAHILYKALLFMAAGSVVLMTGRRTFTALGGGLFRTMPLTGACAIVGALSLSAAPLTSVFLTKSMISQAAADQHLVGVWLLLTAASAGAVIVGGLAFPWFAFFRRASGLRPPDPPWPMRAAMVLLAGASVAIGIVPGVLYGMLPYPVDYAPYTAGHVVSQVQLMLFSGLAFVLMLGLLKRTETITLDVDWLWRRLGPAVSREIDVGFGRTFPALAERTRRGLGRALRTVYRHHGPTGIFGRSWPTGSMAFWAVFLLGAYLVSYYV